jgi:hypothetical protein
MQKPWSPPMRWVFGAATLLGLFSTAQAYRLTSLTSKMPDDIEIVPLLALNFTFWFIPALLAPIIFRLVQRFPIDGHRMQAFAVHAVGYDVKQLGGDAGSRVRVPRRLGAADAGHDPARGERSSEVCQGPTLVLRI